MRYVLKRLVYLVATLLGVVTLVFVLLRLVPGDPASAVLGEFATAERVESLRRQLGLDKPLYVQYTSFVLDALKGDLGMSTQFNEPVSSLVAEKFPHTAYLAVGSILISLLGVPIGIFAALRRNSASDLVVTVGAMVGLSIPNFWLGLLTLWLLASRGWFPFAGSAAGGSFLEVLHHLILPSVVLGTAGMAIVARMSRSSMLEVLGKDYIRTATAKGLGPIVIIWRHALKNASLPILTVVGLNLGYLLGGSIVVEKVFSRIGLGSGLVDAIFMRDYPVIQGIVIVMAVSFMTVNLLVDLLYVGLDPRLRRS